MKINLNNLLNNVNLNVIRDAETIKRVVQSQIDENAPKKLITRDVLKKRSTTNTFVMGVLWLGITLLCFFFFITGKGVKHAPDFVLYIFFGVFFLIGLWLVINPFIVKHHIKNDDLIIEEDVILDSYFERYRDSDGHTHTHYYVELLHYGKVHVLKSTFTEALVDDIAYVVLSEKNKVLGVFPKKLWDVSPELIVTSRVLDEDTLVFHQETTTQEYETKTIDNTFEAKKFKLNNTFEK